MNKKPSPVHYPNDFQGKRQNKSECVPVCRKRSVNWLSFCSHVISQSGSMWHSHCPFLSPDNLWGRYWAGSMPVASSKSIASVMCFMLSPRLMQRRKSFLKRLESDTVYAIAISPFPYKSPLASRNVSLCRASRRPSPRGSPRSW